MKFYIHIHNVRFSSMVKAQVRFALQEIYTDLKNAKYGIAEKKMNILINDWNSFESSDENMGVFSDILYRYIEIDENFNCQEEQDDK